MTYTDAAVEVLRRIGRPTHFKEIAAQAVAEDLLSHVGGAPEATMGARLLAMSNRDGDRRVIATAPGIFALAEWGLDAVKEPSLDESPLPGTDEPMLRPKERHPPLQEEIVLGNRRDDRRRRSDSEDGRRRKRYGPPSEAAHAWLLERRHPASLAEIATALRASDKIAEALERDLASFEKALREENRRRTDQRRPLLFEFHEDGSVTALEPTKTERAVKKDAKGKAKRDKSREEPLKAAAVDEQRKLVLRALRRRLAGLDVAALERVVVALLEAQGYRELNMARRSVKEGPLYLCRHRWGAGELRYAVRVLRSGRDLGRLEVQEVRRDASHFSAQLGVVFGNAECTRDARSEANTPGGVPVMLYGNEALAEALVEAGLGVTRELIEWFDYDETFFDSIGAEAPFEDVDEVAPSDEAPASEVEEASESNGTREPTRDEPRSRRRRRGRRNDREPNGAPDETRQQQPKPPTSDAKEQAPEAESDVAENSVETPTTEDSVAEAVEVMPTPEPAEPAESPQTDEPAEPVEVAEAPSPAPAPEENATEAVEPAESDAESVDEPKIPS